jgi:hypothetical protein
MAMYDFPRRPTTTQTISYTVASAAAANPFGSETYLVRLVANSACHVRIGDGAQTATTADPFLPANWETYFAVTPGQRVAAVRASTGGLVTATDGTLWVTEMS